MSFSAAGSGVSRSLIYFLESLQFLPGMLRDQGPVDVFITEEVGVGDKVRSTAAVVHKRFEASFNMFLRSASAAKVSDLDLHKFYCSTFPKFL